MRESSDKDETFYLCVVVCVVIDIAVGGDLTSVLYWSMALAVFGIVGEHIFDKNPYAVASLVEIMGFVITMMGVILWYSLVLHSAESSTLLLPYVTNFGASLIVSNLGVLIAESVISAVIRA